MSSQKTPQLSTDWNKPIIKLWDLISLEIHRISDLRLGRILTIIDASISDPVQRKGIKDLIKKDYWIENITADILVMLLEFDQTHVNDKLTDKEVDTLERREVPRWSVKNYRSYFGKESVINKL